MTIDRGSNSAHSKESKARILLGGFVVALGCYAAPAWADSSAKPTRLDTRVARRIHPITADVQKTLRSEASATSAPQREMAIRRLVRLHDEIAGHQRFASSQTLQRTIRRIRARLRRVKSQLQDAKKTTPSARRRDFLAQLPAVNRRPPGAAAAAQVVGQPMPRDIGPDLVALIERTISPNIWDVNGGPASIVYFAPRHALVVRAPGEVHQDIGRLVNDLRAAGQ